MKARERILAAAVRRIASEGIDGVRIARIATDAGVSSALVHYHFETREALLAEALDYSYTHAGDARISAGELPGASHAERLAPMIDQCLPTTPELSAGLGPVGRAVAARRRATRSCGPSPRSSTRGLHAWFADEIRAGVADGEFDRCDPEDVADRVLALIDGFGIRTLIGDSRIPLERARRAVAASLARDLGLGERLVRRAGRPQLAHRPLGGASALRSADFPQGRTRRASCRRCRSPDLERRSNPAAGVRTTTVASQFTPLTRRRVTPRLPQRPSRHKSRSAAGEL